MIATFQKLFKRKSQPVEQEASNAPLHTRPLNDENAELLAYKPTGLEIDPPQLIAVCGQSVGQQRDHNEDALFTLTTNLVSDNRHFPFGLYIVADGMGGHQNGEVASALAVRAMSSYILRKIYMPLFSPSPQPPDEPIQEVMQAAVIDAHRTILKQVNGGGTTLTAALILGEQMTIAHVGDSRAYSIHNDGQIEALTRDHSLVKRLEELGQITTEEAAVHPQRNVLYRALGQGEPFDPDIVTAPIPKSGYLLICSDGLWGLVNQKDVISIVFSAANPVQACQRLVEAANTAGGPDNITAILIRMPD